MAELSQILVNRQNPNFLKIYIFNEVTEETIRRQESKKGNNQGRQETYPNIMLETFNKMCEKYGDNVMDYSEFEFWYWRFFSGNFDLDFDKSADPTTRSFTDLPVRVFEKISEKFNFADKLIVRRVSKPLQSLIDSWKPNIRSIKVSSHSLLTCLEFDKDRISYSPQYFENPSRREHCIVDVKEFRFIIEDEQHWRLGFQDLKAVLGNPKLNLNSLEISRFEKEHMEHFLKMLNSLNGAQIHVENFKLSFNSTNSNLLSTMQHLNPKVLKEIYFELSFNEDQVLIARENISKLGSSEQLKNVEMVTIRGSVGREAQLCSLELPRVTYEFSGMDTADQIGNAVNTLVESPVLEICYFKNMWFFDIDAVMGLLGARFLRVDDRPNVRRHEVPGSDQFYEIEILTRMIRIERMP